MHRNISKFQKHSKKCLLCYKFGEPCPLPASGYATAYKRSTTGRDVTGGGRLAAAAAGAVVMVMAAASRVHYRRRPLVGRRVTRLVSASHDADFPSSLRRTAHTKQLGVLWPPRGAALGGDRSLSDSVN